MAQELGELRALHAADLRFEGQPLLPGVEVALFSGAPSVRRELIRWPQPGGGELVLTLEYSGAVEHVRFDVSPSTGYAYARGTFGEWSVCLNGHVLWTANQSPYLYNGEIPGQLHRDADGLPVNGCWRTVGYSLCDQAYAGGTSNANVELATSGGGSAEFGYSRNDPLSGNPVLLALDPASRWTASLAPPAQAGRTLRLKKPDGTTWTFREAALALSWQGYYYNNNLGPRAFRLTRFEGPTPDVSVDVSYEYADSALGHARELHPTAIHIRDQSRREIHLESSLDAAHGTLELSVSTSLNSDRHRLSFEAPRTTDRQMRSRLSYLYRLARWVDRAGRVTAFRYDEDVRAEAYAANCADSLDVRAHRLVGLTTPGGADLSLRYLPIPATRPGCPSGPSRYQDDSWQHTGRSTSLVPMVSRAELRAQSGGMLHTAIDFEYSWLPGPNPGEMESEAQRYHTSVHAVAGPGAPVPAGGVAEFRVKHEFGKLPYRLRTFDADGEIRWATRPLRATLLLASGEAHEEIVEYDAPPRGGARVGTFLPSVRRHRVSRGIEGPLLAEYQSTLAYDSLARVVREVDPLGTSVQTRYFEQPSLHSPWTPSGGYRVDLPEYQASWDAGGALLSETWLDREPGFGRTVAEHRRVDADRVALTTFAYDEAAPSRMVGSVGPGGEHTEYQYDPLPMPGTIYYADGPEGVFPLRTRWWIDPTHTLELFQSFSLDGLLLRESDGAGRASFFGYDPEGRPRTRALPGDMMTGPPPSPERDLPSLPPYDLTPWPSSVLGYQDGPGAARINHALYPGMLDSLRRVSDLDGFSRPVSLGVLGSGAPRSRQISYDGFGNLAHFSESDGGWFETAFDEFGRPLVESSSGGGRRTRSYEVVASLSAVGLDPPGDLAGGYFEVERVTHTDGHVELRARDARGANVALADLPPGGGTPLRELYFSLDGVGRVRQVLRGNREFTRFEYDLDGDLVRTTLPSGGVRSTIFDLRHHPAFTQDESGAQGAAWGYLRYDLHGRLVEEGELAGVGAPELQAMADAGALPGGARWSARRIYDDAPVPDGAGFLRWSLVQQSDGRVDSVEYHYDLRGRVSTRTVRLAGLPRPRALGFAYDRLDRVTQVSYPDGRVMRYLYDAGRGQLASVRDGSGVELAHLDRDVYGRLTGIRGGGLEVLYQRGSSGQVIRQQARSAGRMVLDESWEQDGDGRIQARSAGPSDRREFTRDPAGRLESVRFTAEPGAPAASYHYDSLGEIDSLGSDLGSSLFQLSSGRPLRVQRPPHGQERLGLNTHGDITQRVWKLEADTLGSQRLEWSSTHRLLSLVGNSEGRRDSLAYTYDAGGARTRVAGTRGTRYEIRDDAGNLFAELDSAGNVTTDYLRVGRALLGEWRSDGTRVRYVTDPHGDIRLGVDESGQVRFRQDFLPYGELALREGGEVPRFGFAGGEQDPLTGTVWFGLRVYDPELARFLSPDPIMAAGNLPYAYGDGDPLTFEDPDGLDPALSQEITRIFTVPTVWVFGNLPTPRRFNRLIVGLYRTDRLESAVRWYQRYRRFQQWVHRIARPFRLRAEGSAATASGELRGVPREQLPVSTRAQLEAGEAAVTLTARSAAIHEILSVARVHAALVRNHDLTPDEATQIRLKAGVVMLSELTLDAAAILALGNPLGEAAGTVGFAAFMSVRGQVSDFTDGLLGQFVPGYQAPLELPGWNR